jgi:4a-hydroxytetrahydrobiopterin dehydratase
MITRTFPTADFATGLDFVNRIGQLAEAAGHHPDLTLTYATVVVNLTTHDAGAVTSQDLDLAAQINNLWRRLKPGAES